MLPELEGRRVLVEVAEPVARRIAAGHLRARGFEVLGCDGRGPSGEGCPLLHGLPCRLVEQADAVLCGLPDARITQAVLAAAHDRAEPLAGVDAAAVMAPVRLIRGRRARKVRRFVDTRGRRLLIRPPQRSDAARILQFENGLSETTRYLRYLSYMPPLTSEAAEQQASVDFDRRFAFIAIDGHGDQRQIVADARLLAYPKRPAEAEIAVAVADRLQGFGLGPRLLWLLLEIAAERGFEAVSGDVLVENRPMLRVLQRLGFERTESERGVMTLSKRLPSRFAAMG